MVFRYLTPRYPVDQLRHDMNRLLNGFFATPGNESAAREGRPAVNGWDRDESLFVELEVPGVTSEQLDISVVDNELSIRLERPDVQQDGVTYHRRERPVGAFTRVLRLPVDVDADQVSANLRDGILTIELPKAESARPRKIEVAKAT
ncbi:MAG: Hsp20/alpha crystallin family protein [Pirellulales bacterium]|nr:Hsp20/alpha crystallin family protein [Pirellulales bacterium]